MRQLAMHALIYLLAIASVAFVTCQDYAAGDELQVRIAYLAWQPDPGPLLSNAIAEPPDAGLRGAELAIKDSNSTGRFLKHSYRLDSVQAQSPEQLLERAAALHAEGLRLFVGNAPAAQLTALARAMPDSLLLNAGSADDDLRRSVCQANLLHSLPSRAMLTDAQLQFLATRQWQRLLLIVGQTPDDQHYAAALRRSAG